MLGLFLVLTGTCCSANAPVIPAAVSPLREFYHLGEPIELQLAIRNATEREATIRFDYPDFVGVSFSCKDGDAIPIPSPVIVGRPVPLLPLKAGEEYKRIIALNRYLRFDRAKRYTVAFKAIYYQDLANPPLATSKGQFVIDIRPGPIARGRLRGHIRAIDARDPNRVQDATEMLLWADDPIVIAPLARAAKRARGFRNRILRALEKFFPQQRGRAAILEVASEGTRFTLRAALRLFEEKKTKVPLEFCQARLSSRSTGHQLVMLDYLARRGGPEHVVLVKPFAEHANPELRKLAARFLARVPQ